MVAVAGARSAALTATQAPLAAMNGGFSAAFAGAGAIAFMAAGLAAVAIRSRAPESNATPMVMT
jgi:hypothetical protein